MAQEMLPPGGAHPQELGLGRVKGQAVLLRPHDDRHDAIKEAKFKSFHVGRQTGRIQLHVIRVAVHGQSERDSDFHQTRYEENEQQRAENRPLRNTMLNNSLFRRLTAAPDRLRPITEVALEPAEDPTPEAV